MNDNNRLLFDKLRALVENDLYNGLFLVFRDNNYFIDGNEVIGALNEIRIACDNIENEIKKD